MSHPSSSLPPPRLPPPPPPPPLPPPPTTSSSEQADRHQGTSDIFARAAASAAMAMKAQQSYQHLNQQPGGVGGGKEEESGRGVKGENNFTQQDISSSQHHSFAIEQARLSISKIASTAPLSAISSTGATTTKTTTDSTLVTPSGGDPRHQRTEEGRDHSLSRPITASRGTKAEEGGVGPQASGALSYLQHGTRSATPGPASLTSKSSASSSSSSMGGGATDTTIGNLKTPSGSSASSSKKATGATAEGPVNTTDELGRRVWDKAFYESLAQTKEDDDDFFSYLPQPRQRKIAPPVEHRKALQRRDFHIDLAKEIGKTKIVTLQTPRMQQGGFWCDVCECLIKDSAAYLDHINGRNHNRMLGMTMRVERATPARVIGKLRELQRVAQVELEGEDPSSTVEPSGAASSSGGSSGVTGGSGAGSSSASSNSHHHHSMSSTHTGSLTGSDERGSGGVGTSSSAAGGAGQYGEENYDDIDRIKRRLEELQRQDEERKLRKKMKKRKKEKAEGEGDTKKNGVTKDEGGDAAERQGDAEEDEEQKMLKAMGLPSSFVGT